MSFSLKGRGYDINEIKRERNRTNKKFAEEVKEKSQGRSGGVRADTQSSGDKTKSCENVAPHTMRVTYVPKKTDSDVKRTMDVSPIRVYKISDRGSG